MASGNTVPEPMFWVGDLQADKATFTPILAGECAYSEDASFKTQADLSVRIFSYPGRYYASNS
jgi:hypothetical protein